VLGSRGIDQVVVAMPADAHDRLGTVLKFMGEELVDVRVVPDIHQYITLRGGVEDFDGLAMVRIQDSPMAGWNRLGKRAFDIAVSAALLVVASPVMLLTAAVIKILTPGPVFYRQTRMGFDGRCFEMLKFRTMTVDAERETGAVWATKDDPRRTPLGRVLRKLSLDELPQLLNVLRGDMSLVGPRPERPELIGSSAQIRATCCAKCEGGRHGAGVGLPGNTRWRRESRATCTTSALDHRADIEILPRTIRRCCSGRKPTDEGAVRWLRAGPPGLPRGARPAGPPGRRCRRLPRRPLRSRRPSIATTSRPSRWRTSSSSPGRPATRPRAGS
jgi:lipopolysaccharide/colanic/teichoic acid biosynthesis glycosyltransferase